jgi:hypothetical protein
MLKSSRFFLCLSTLLLFFALQTRAQSAGHPLDGLTTQDYWTVYETLHEAGHATPETLFASVLLRPLPKAAVLAWKPGQPNPRAADVILLRGNKSFTALVDIAAKKVVRFQQLNGEQAPFLASELFGADEYIKKDPRVIEALKERGITDLRTVQCFALPVACQAIGASANSSFPTWIPPWAGITALLTTPANSLLPPAFSNRCALSSIAPRKRHGSMASQPPRLAHRSLPRNESYGTEDPQQRGPTRIPRRL